MAAAVAQSHPGSVPAAPAAGDGTGPVSMPQKKTLDDIRVRSVGIADELGTLPIYTPEHIQALKLARKEVIEFYSTLPQEKRVGFLEHSRLERIDPELWLELLEQNKFETTWGVASKLWDLLSHGHSPRLSRICREIICTSELPLDTRLRFVGKHDHDLQLLLYVQSGARGLDYDNSRRDHFSKPFIEGNWGKGAKEFWIRAGVYSEGGWADSLPVDLLVELSPASIATLTVRELYDNSGILGNERIGLAGLSADTINLLEEKLTLIRSEGFDAGPVREMIRQVRERKASMHSPLSALWRKAHEDAGLSHELSINDMLMFLDYTTVHAFLTWWNTQPDDKYDLPSDQVVERYQNDTRQTQGDQSLGALISLLQRPSFARLFRGSSPHFGGGYQPTALSFIKSRIPPHVPDYVPDVVEAYEGRPHCLHLWLEQNQEKFLELLQRSLLSIDQRRWGWGKDLQRIHAAVLFLREFRPKESEEILGKIAELPLNERYEAFSSEGLVFKALTYSAYHRVTMLPTDELEVLDETALYDPTRLYLTVPAGNRWIFLEGLEPPHDETLRHACTLLNEVLSGELRINCSERVPKTDSRRQKLSKAHTLLADIDRAALDERDAIFHAALVPLFGKLAGWMSGERTDIEMIVEVQRSGLARPADPCDTVKIPAGNFFDHVQKKHQRGEVSYLLRECPVLNQERFKKNLITTGRVLAALIEKQRIQIPAQAHSEVGNQMLPAIKRLEKNPAILYRLSHSVSGDNQYLATDFFGRMKQDYSYEPLLSGAVATFIASLNKAISGSEVTLVAEVAGNGAALPCPHHGTIDTASVTSALENITIAQRPGGAYFIKGGAGCADVSVTMMVTELVPDLDTIATFDQVKCGLSPEIYEQLTTPLARLDELPRPLQKAIVTARTMSVAEAASYLERFIQERYVYSFDVMESAAYRGFQREQEQGVVRDYNAYLHMIHAQGERGGCLGKGVCGQLSTVLLAALRLAGVPSLMTAGYLATERHISSNMGHAYVSVVLPCRDGAWRLKPLEATSAGVDGLIELLQHEQRRLLLPRPHVIDMESTLEQPERPPTPTHVWAWLAHELGDGLLALTESDAAAFYRAFIRCRGAHLERETTYVPTSVELADAYAVLLGTPSDLAERVYQELLDLPHLRVVVRHAIDKRDQIIKGIERTLSDVQRPS